MLMNQIGFLRLFYCDLFWSSVTVHSFSPEILEAEAGEYLSAQGQYGPYTASSRPARTTQ